MPTTIRQKNRIVEVIRRGQRGLDGDVGLTTTVTKATGHTAVAGERGYVFRFTAAVTFSLEEAAVLTNGWHCIVTAANGAVTVDPSGSETINGATTLTIRSGASALIYTDGTYFYANYFYSDGAISLLGYPTVGDRIIYSTGPGEWAEATLSSFMRTLLDDTSAATARTTLGLSSTVTGKSPVLLQTVDVTGLAGAALTAFNNTLYSEYSVKFHNFKPATDGVGLHLRVSTNGGVSYRDGASDYAWGVNGITAGGTAFDQSDAADAQIVITSGLLGNASGEDGASGEVRVRGAWKSLKTMMDWNIEGFNNAGGFFMGNGAGACLLQEDVDAVDIYFSSGTVSVGHAYLFGWPR